MIHPDLARRNGADSRILRALTHLCQASSLPLIRGTVAATACTKSGQNGVVVRYTDENRTVESRPDDLSSIGVGGCFTVQSDPKSPMH
jgi:hypothetical protein